MSFLSNFNILIQILLGPTNLLESNEDMLIYIYICFASVTCEKGDIRSIFKKFRKMSLWKWDF